MENEKVRRALAPIRDAETFGDARQMLAGLIGLTEPAPPGMTARVLVDTKFAALVAGMGHLPGWRDRLVNDPFNGKFAPPDIADDAADAASLPKTRELVSTFAKGVATWAGSGFTATPPEKLAVRKAACEACDQLTEAPNEGLHRIARAVAGPDKRMCRACGCLMSKKIALDTEHCPLPNKDTPTLSRWGEPLEN